MAKLKKEQIQKNAAQMQALCKYINASAGSLVDPTKKLETFYDNFVLSVMGKGDKTSIIKDTKETGIYTELTGVTSYIPHKEEAGYSVRDGGAIYGKLGDMYFLTEENRTKTVSRPKLTFWVMGNNDSMQQVSILETTNHKEVIGESGALMFNGYILKSTGMDQVNNMDDKGNYAESINTNYNTRLRSVVGFCKEIDAMRNAGYDPKMVSDAMTGQVNKHRAESYRTIENEMSR